MQNDQEKSTVSHHQGLQGGERNQDYSLKSGFDLSQGQISFLSFQESKVYNHSIIGFFLKGFQQDIWTEPSFSIYRRVVEAFL